MMVTESELKQQIEDAEDLEQLAKPLEELLSGPYNVWPDGRLVCIKVLVETVNGLKIEIRHREHAPPHFHVKGSSLEAAFSIESGALLSGNVTHRHLSLIEWWYERSKGKLINIWNNTRPSDCPVGPIRMK